MAPDRSLSQSLLIVDDEPQVLTALRDLLEEEYQILTHTSARQAIRELERDESVAVVISDQRMPEMSGDEFLARAREVSLATRLLITGYADLQAVIRAINDGKVFGYISKPWDPDHLQLVVHKAVENFQITRELNEERALLENLMDHLPDGVYFKDQGHRYLRINRAKARMLGIASPELAVGRSVESFYDRARAMEVEHEEDAIIRTGQPLVDKIERLVTADRIERWFSTTKAPVFSERGRIMSLVCVARDITERQRAQESLRESERRHRSLYNKTPVMMMSIDRDGRLVSVSDHWCETLGYSREECLGRPARVFMTEGSGHRFERELLLAALTQLEVKDAGCQLVAKDGSVLEILLSAVGEREESGETSGVLAVAIDVTEKSILQSQFLQAQKMEAVGQLTGGLAHDFNNLLAIIIGNLELLAEQIAEDASSGRLAEAALSAGLRGAELTRQLLAFSRRQVLESKVIDLNGLVSGMTSLLARTLGEQIEVATKLAGDLWPAYADPSQVESALANLAINARDAMPEGGRLTIETANRALDEDYVAENAEAIPGEYAMLAVSDTGSGIPEDVLSRVFEPFFTTKTDGQGTGLGLSMVYGFARQSGGHVKIYSEVGHGTTVRLYLPRARDPAEAAADPGTRAETLKGSGTVLVVEDNPGVREIAARQLADLGYRVLEAASAREALGALESDEPVDLLFTDVVMPGGMSGTELARVACELRPGLKVLFTSGFAEEAMRREGHLQSRHDLLMKPYLRRDLARKVLQALQRSET